MVTPAVGREKKPLAGEPNRRRTLAALVGLLVVVAVGFLGHGKFFSRPPKEPSRPAVGKPLPPAPNEGPSPAPTKAVPVAGGAEAPVEAKPVAPVRQVAPPPAAPLKPSPPVAPDPSLQFRTFVDHLKGAVRVGPPTRLIVNGLSYRPGEVIDPKLGVVFVGLDPETQELIFQDPTGAVIRRLF